MNVDFDFGLSCLTDEDSAAIALYMQSMALAIDTQLATQLAEFNGFLANPTALATTTTTQTGIANGIFTGIGSAGAGDYTLTFANYTPVDWLPSLATFANGDLAFPDDRSGWYHIGCYVPMTASGAITALSFRQAFLTASSYVTSDLLVGTQEYSTIRFDSSTAGEHLMVQGTVFVESGSKTFLSASVLHANAASTVNVPAGATIWLHYLGPSDLVRTVS